MDKEIWKSIPGYEGRYEASTFGRVRRCERRIKSRNFYGPYDGILKQKIMAQMIDKDGYLRVGLVDRESVRTNHTVHYLVAITFLGERPRKASQINHIDCDKENNRADNLEWCTAKENHRHAYENGIHALNKHRCPKTGLMLPVGSKNKTKKARRL